MAERGRTWSDRDRFVASSLERTKHPSIASRCCPKRGTLPEDRGGATEGRIRAHVQAVQGQSESAEKRYKDVVDKLNPSLSLHFAVRLLHNQTSAKHKLTTTSATIFFF